MDDLTEEQKRALAANPCLTLEGKPVALAGVLAPVATLTGEFAGFWSCSWETVREVVSQGGSFAASHVRLAGRAWQGVGVDLPPALASKWR